MGWKYITASDQVTIRRSVLTGLILNAGATGAGCIHLMDSATGRDPGSIIFTAWAGASGQESLEHHPAPEDALAEDGLYAELNATGASATVYWR